MRRFRSSVVVAIAALLLPAGARAVSSYSITYNRTTVRTSTAPVGLDTTVAYDHGIGFATARASVQATAGATLGTASIRDELYGVYGGPASIEVVTSSNTNEFVITGPPGATSVTGTFYFVLEGGIDLTGGYPGNNGQGGILQFTMRAGSINWLGQWFSGNGSSSGSYGLTGASGPGQTIGLAGDYPVGVGFPCYMTLDQYNFTYANSNCSPAIVASHGGLAPSGAPASPGLAAPGVAIGNGAGLVMALPAGYTVSCPAWNVVNNHVVSPILGVAPAPHGATQLALLSASPAAGAVRLRYALAAPGRARLVILDVTGRVVRTVADDWRPAGAHEAAWDGADATGHAVAPGVYFAALEAGSDRRVVRFIRIE